MCLIRGSTKKAAKTSGYGYKVFETNGKALYGVCFAAYTPRPSGEWLQSTDLCIFSGKDNSANVGWHIYVRKADAKRLLASRSTRAGLHMVLRRVKYRGAEFEGLGDGGWNYFARIVVAKEMFIL